MHALASKRLSRISILIVSALVLSGCGQGDGPPWRVFSDSRGANLTIDVNDGTFLFIYLTM